MKKLSRLTAGQRAWGLVLALSLAAFTLACRLVPTVERGSVGQTEWAAQLLGESRLAIGAAFYEQADTVFHKGVGHFEPQAFEHGFARLSQAIAPSGHTHLHEDSIAEILPWLNFTVRADPQNVMAYAVAAFWLAGTLDRPDLAWQVLEQARRANPRDYRVYLELGRLALKQEELSRGARLLQAGLKLWPGQQDPEDRQVQLDRAEIMMYLGLLHERAGEFARAQGMYRSILESFPERHSLRNRLAFLEAHGRSPSAPFHLWHSMLGQHAGVCPAAHQSAAPVDARPPEQR